jgi:hypothetical protein
MCAMRFSLFGLAIVSAAVGAGCMPEPEPRTPGRAARVVSASDAVVVVYACDDDDDCEAEVAQPRPPIEYVKLSEWQPSPQVVELEAKVPSRGDEPPTYTTYPKLTRHHPIGETTAHRFSRFAR